MNEELKVIIRAELAQFKKAMSDAISGLKQVANEGRKASKEIDGFTADVNQQGKALSDLKKKYIDLAAAHGKESKEAKDAAEAIRKLSAEYKINKNLATDLANEANSFDISLGDEETSRNVNKTNASVEELQGTLDTIRNMSIGDLLLDAFGDGLRDRIRAINKELDWAKAYGSEGGSYFKQIFESFNKNSDLYADLDGWTGWGDAFKNAGGSIKDMFSDMGKGMKHSFKAIGEAGKAAFEGIKGAMSGVVAIAAIVIADLLIMIGLTKNALARAKEIKAMASEASKIGMETDAYGEWAYVLKQVGIESDKLTDFLKTLTEEQNAVRDGSEDMIKAFEGIGLSAEEVMGSSQEELFKKTVAGLQGVENASERTSLAYKIFGEDAADLANILYLNNQEVQSLINNYNNLGAAPSDNLIQKSKILEGSTTNLSYAWQGLKNTLAEWVMPLVISVVQWLTKAVAYINVFLQGVFGIDLGLGKAANKGSTSMDKMNESVKENVKDAKELRRILMGFDELNVVSDPNKSDSSTGSGAGGGAYSAMGINPELPVIEVPDMTKFKEFMAEYGSMIQGILTWSLIGIGVILAVLGFMNGNFALALLGISLAGLGIGVGAAGGEESHWNKLGNAIKEAWKGLENWFKQNVAPIFTKEWWAEKFDNIKTAAGEKLAEIKTKIDEKIAPIKDWFENKVKPIFTKEYWTTLFDNIKQAASDKLGEIKQKIDEKIKPIKDWFENKLKPIFTKEYWINLWNNVKQAAGDKIAEIKQKIDEKIAPLKDWFNNKLKPIFTVDYWKQKWNSIKDGAKSAFNGVIDIVENAINKIIKQINKLSWDIPDWVPIVGGEKFGFDFKTISIPRLAEGGIVNSSVLANIGERGREAVLPLENNTEWMDKLAARISGNSPSKIVLMIDGRELGQATINSINDITRQTGTLQLVMA